MKNKKKCSWKKEKKLMIAKVTLKVPIKGVDRM